jgi:DNA modification methylase
VSQLPIFDDPTEKEPLASEQPEGKRANDLSGKEWTKNSISIWSDIRKSKEETDLGHPAIFPSELVKRLIETFTRTSEKVILDPFSGSGSTVVTASRMGRIGIGFDINPNYIELTEARLRQRDIWQTEIDTQSQIYLMDARHLLNVIQPNSVDMVITSPPYWDILSRERTADGKDIRDYGNAVDDLGKIDDYQQFINELAMVFKAIYTVLKAGKYCCVVVMDIRKKNKFYPFHADIAVMMEEIGFIYDDLIIWDRRHEYNNLRPLGYPSVFRINKCHEYILIFQKPSGD